MSELPPALSAWAPELEGFVPSLALSLGEPIRRLAAAMGPLGRKAVAGDAEPDGFDGLTRRGPYDRLLLAEWALAEEVPDEFLRRAAEHEHAFLRLARIDPARSRRCVVLLDQGCEQIGAPRLGHLAALIVFARRAREAHAELRFGCLAGGDLHAEVSPGSLQSLRDRRSHALPEQAMLDAWQERLAPVSAEDDLWLVGGPGVRRLEGGLSTLVIEEAVALDGAALDATLRGRTVRLPLPDSATCVSLLRRPLGAPRQRAFKARPTSPSVGAMWFSPDGNRLMVVGVDGDPRAIHVPVNPRTTPGNTKWLQLRGESLGWFGFHKRRMLVLSRSGDALRVRIRGEAHDRPWPEGLVLPEAPRALFHTGSGVNLLDDTGQVWFVPTTADRPVRQGKSGVLCLGLYRALILADEGLLWGWPERTDTQLVERSVGAVEACLSPWQRLGFRVGARWYLQGPDAGPPKAVVEVEGAEVHDVTRLEQDDVLLAISADRRELLALTAQASALVVSVPAGIDAVCAHDTKGLIAYRDEQGTIVVQSQWGEVRRLTPGVDA